MQLNRELLEKIEEIITPYATSRIKALLARHGRLVHYTTAENALKIIKSTSLWLRNARVMSDFSEVQHGFNQLLGYFQNPSYRDRFFAALGKVESNLGKDAVAMFDQKWQQLQFTTYISCLSEHNDDEDIHGRLSMWRAFGKSTAGVAIVLKTPPPNSAPSLNVYLYPVAYFSDVELQHEMENVLTNIAANKDMLKALGRDMLIRLVYMTLVMLVVSVKHPGFREEKEWRIIYMPTVSPSPFVSASTEIIGGGYRRRSIN